MSSSADLLNLIKSHGHADAMVWRNQTISFDDLFTRVDAFEKLFADSGVRSGAVVSIEGEFSPASVAALIALIKLQAIALPLTSSVASKKGEYHCVAQTEWILKLDNDDQETLLSTGQAANSNLVLELRKRMHPGLILFSSGSTGRSKAIVHDIECLSRKYLTPRHSFRSLAFLMFDHIGGIDTLLYNLANGSCLITIPNHSPDAVCEAIEKHRVEVLPTSPTFLNLLLLSGAHTSRNLKSLKIITYGSEIMPSVTLNRLTQVFPEVKFLQKFGTTEVGTLRSQSRESGSVWVKIGGEGYQTRVQNGLLEIKADSAMLGYLNAPDPFTEDGWFITGDMVEVDGEFLKFLGRQSDVINIGGEKVYPAEVESVLQQMEDVDEVVVVGEANPITGRIVVAKIKLRSDETASLFRKRMWNYCSSRLPNYKIPQKVVLSQQTFAGERFKKMRRDFAEGELPPPNG